MELNGKKIAILGLGISGLAVAKLLHARGAVVSVFDGNQNAKLEERAAELRALGVTVELQTTPLSPHDFAFAVLSPGIDPKIKLVQAWQEKSVLILSELELASRLTEWPIIAITGTNGKTTTTELVEAVLRAAGKKTVACGNIGKALSTVVREENELDAVVVEVSSFQLEQIETFRPKVSVYLNLTPDHLDRYASMEEYAEAKEQIFRNQTNADVAIVNANLKLPKIHARVVTINANGVPADYELREGYLVARGEKILEQNQTHLVGPHNAENMLAALAVADELSLPRSATLAALSAYLPLPHRCEKVRELDGVVYINDSKATNIDALEKALLAMTAPVVLLAGGKDKGLSFESLVPLVREKVKAAVLIGQMTEKLTKTWESVVTCFPEKTLFDAVLKAQSLAQAGDIVLLSPGCSSFDMFKSFEDRGDQFRQIVQNLSPTLKTQPPTQNS